jgi:hypothetical protein
VGKEALKDWIAEAIPFPNTSIIALAINLLQMEIGVILYGV